MTTSYKTAPNMALLVLAGVEPIDLTAQYRAAVFHLKQGRNAKIARKNISPPKREPTPTATALAIKRLGRAVVLDEWQERWELAETGRLTFKFFPRIAERLEKFWLGVDFDTTQFLTGHGAIRAYQNRFGFSRDKGCPCGGETQDR